MPRFEIRPETVALVSLGGTTRERRDGEGNVRRLEDGRPTTSLPVLLAAAGDGGELEGLKNASVYTADDVSKLTFPLGAVLRVSRASLLAYSGSDGRTSFSVLVEGVRADRAGGGAANAA